MPWLPYNPNPDGITTGDCTIRAICAVTGLDWKTAHTAVCELARDMSDMPSTNRVWWAFLRAIGFRQFHLIDTCPACYTVRDFALDHPHGKYILGPHEHAVAVVDGWYMDSWDSGSTVPTYYFEEELNHGMGAIQHTTLPGDEQSGVSDGVSAGMEPADVPAATDGADDDAADDPGGDRSG